MARTGAEKLGKVLIEAGVLTQDQLDEALKLQEATGKFLGEVLVELGKITREEMGELLELQYQHPYVHLAEYILDPDCVNMLTREVAERYQAIPIHREGKQLTVAMANPEDLPTIDYLRSVTRLSIRPVVSTPREITESIERYYSGGGHPVDEGAAAKVEDIRPVSEDPVDDEPLSVPATPQVSEMAEDAPVVQLVSTILVRAVREQASDVHIQVDETEMLVRFRIDGLLRDVLTLPRHLHPALLSRIKVMGNLDITERRRPQDGRIELKIEDRSVDLRVSTLPTLFGEKVVMRILDKTSALLRLDQIGLSEEQYRRINLLVRRPHGMLLVTGPTGSGKTTTLYAGLTVINSPEKNIVTVEDPVEYQLQRINQVAVNTKVQLTFAAALRSILRQDPDIVMIGEIRDLETARIAINASLTGHLVFSTLHTNDAAGAISRLIDMEIEPFLIASALEGVLAQRLLRRLCDNCKERYDLSSQMAITLGLTESRAAYRAKGCPECEFSGYHGRVGIYELLVMNPEIRKMVVNRADSSVIRQASISAGMSSLRQNAIAKLLAGETTIEEVLRLTLQ